MRPNFPHRERGAVLIVSLLFLVILTMLGVTAMTSTTMEERMAGNTRDTSVAFQAADSALRDARRDLAGYTLNAGLTRTAKGLKTGWGLDKSNYGSSFGDATCNTTAAGLGLCLPAVYVGGESAELPPMPNYNMTASPSVAYGQFTGAPALQGVSAQPHYIIEMFCLVSSVDGISAGSFCNFLRITAVGYGANPSTRVQLQEIIAKEA